MLPIYPTQKDALEGGNTLPRSARLIPGQSIWLINPESAHGDARHLTVATDPNGRLFGESGNWIAPLRKDDSGWFAISYVDKHSYKFKNLRFYTRLRPKPKKEK